MARRNALFLFSIALSAGCANSAGLTVDVRTDYLATEEFGAVRTEISPTPFASDAPFGTPAEVAVAPAFDFLSGARVAEFRELPPGAYWVRVSLLSDTGSVIAQRTTTLQFTSTFSMTSVISRSCEGALCPPNGSPRLTACNGGVCVDPGCTPETPELCGAGECARDADCTSGPPGDCVRAVCEGNACLYGGDDALCGRAEHCSVALLCVPDAQPSCGRRDEPCCGGTCGAGSVCSATGVCVSCGRPNEACCDGACNAGATCASNACRPCGGREEPCCSGSACRDGALCADTSSGQRCQCGARSQICCNGTTCDTGILCIGTGFGPLCLCGTRGTPCCPGRACDDGSTCLDTGYGPLCLCGTRDTPCCAGRVCDDGSLCLDTGFGPLCLCGTSGRPCCAGRACDGGLSCNDTGFGPICQ